MLHTIQADFYRLFSLQRFLDYRSHSRSQHPVWSHLWSYWPRRRQYGTKLPQATEVWTGFKALTNYSSSISVTILFTIIVITLVLGTDLTQNLYKNSLAYGVSRTSYYFAKSAVVLTIALFQFLVSYGLVFLIATLYNGLGTMPEHFLAHFGLTVLIQFLSTLAWSASFPSFFMPANPSPWPSLATSLEISS